MPTYEDIKDDLRRLWDTAQLRPERAARAQHAAERCLAGAEHYKRLEALLGVPWAFIAVIHGRESDWSFGCHLHNGDRLTGRTYHVPAGRPIAGPANGVSYTWEESAMDALRQKGHQNIKDWCIERILYELERFNGFGYRNHGMTSPYLWADTTVYHGGKYVSDGALDRGTFDVQYGCADVLKLLIEQGHFSVVAHAERETEIDAANKAGKATDGTPEEPGKPLRERSRKYWWTRWQEKIYASIAAAAIAIKGRVDDMWNDPFGALDTLKLYAQQYGVELLIVVGIGGLLAWSVIKKWQVEDIQEGRSIPSGDTQ